MYRIESAYWAADASRALVTRRSRLWYARVFGVPKDAVTLDIGAGLTRNRPDNFVSFDYLYARARIPAPDSPLIRTLLSRAPVHKGQLIEGQEIPGSRNIGGLAQALPFRSESFDRTIASYSLLHVDDGLEVSLAEIMRVTKTGGYIQIAPGHKRLKARKEAKMLESQQRAFKRRPLPGITTISLVASSVNEIAESVSANLLDHDITMPGVLKVVGTTALMGALTTGIRFFTDPSVLVISRGPELSEPATREQFAQELVSAYNINLAAASCDQDALGS